MTVLITSKAVTVIDDSKVSCDEYIRFSDLKKLCSDKQLVCNLLQDRGLQFMYLKIV